MTSSRGLGRAPARLEEESPSLVGPHLAEIGDHVFGRGRDEEEAASEVKMDEGGRSRHEVYGDDTRLYLRRTLGDNTR
ncbi:hypothetical protein ACSQ67_020550 [Phaseolus vulgaris]